MCRNGDSCGRITKRGNAACYLPSCFEWAHALREDYLGAVQEEENAGPARGGVLERDSSGDFQRDRRSADKKAEWKEGTAYELLQKISARDPGIPYVER